MAVQEPARRQSTHRVGWVLVLGAAIAAAAVVVWHLTVIPIGDPFYGLFHNLTDLKVYRAGGQTVLNSAPLYRHPVQWTLDFTYPPFAAIVFVPLALLGFAGVAVVWWVGIYAALVATVLLGFRSLGYRIDSRLWALAALLAVCVTALEPVRTTVWLGQINVFLMFIILLDLVFLDLARPASRLRGVGVGIAAGLKLTPAFFLVYLLAVRRWRAAATAVVAFAGTVVVGFLLIPGDARDYWTTYVGGADRVGRVDSPANQSVNGFLSQMLAYFDIGRFRHPDPGGGFVYEAPTWLWVPVAVVVAVVGVWTAVLAYRRGWRLLAVTITGMTGAAVSPFSWGHHWVWFVPLLVVAIDLAYRATLASRSGAWLWALPAILVGLAFTWSHTWTDVGPRLGAPHPIAIGTFMMPRWPDPQWYDRLMVGLYAGCYSLVLLLTVIATLVAIRRRRDPDTQAADTQAPDTQAADTHAADTIGQSG